MSTQQTSLLPIIRDIRDGNDGVTTFFQSTEEILRTGPESVIAPFGFRPDFHIKDTTIKGNFYVAKANSKWILDGHRYLINQECGFFLDRVVGLPDNRLKELLYTDHDTGLSKKDDQTMHFEYHPKRLDLPVIKLNGRIGYAVSVEPSNWGSFVSRVLPKAIALRALGVDKLLAYTRHPSQRQCLELIGWKPNQIIDHKPYNRYYSDEAIYPSEFCEQLALGIMGKSLLEKVRPISNIRNRKLFVSRRPNKSSYNKRYCINHEELEKLMVDLGFEIISPELFSAEEQIKCFSEAAIIVGPSGAGLFNTVFCHPGTVVIDIESEPNWIHGHCNLFSSLGLRYSINVAQPIEDANFPPPHRPFAVNLDALAEQVKNLCKTLA